MIKYYDLKQPAGTAADVLTKSLVTSLSCAHLLRRTCQVLKEHHLVMNFGSALFYIDTAFFSIAAIYCLISLLLAALVVKKSSHHSIDQEIEMTEKQASNPEIEKKSTTKPQKSDDEDGEQIEEDVPLPNYQQMSKFLVTSGLLAMLFFFGSLVYDHFLARRTTCSRHLLSIHRYRHSNQPDPL